MAIPHDYQAVSVYLPPHLAQKVKDYALDRGLSRKSKDGDKPALGTAIVELLSAALDESTSPSQLLSNLPNQLPDNVLISVLERLDKLESLTNQLLDSVPSRFGTLSSSLPSNVSVDRESMTNTLPSPLRSSQDAVTSDIQSPDDLCEGLTSAQLARIIGVNRSTISRRLKRGQSEICGYIHQGNKWYQCN